MLILWAVRESLSTVNKGYMIEVRISRCSLTLMLGHFSAKGVRGRSILIRLVLASLQLVVANEGGTTYCIDIEHVLVVLMLTNVRICILLEATSPLRGTEHNINPAIK